MILVLCWVLFHWGGGGLREVVLAGFDMYYEECS